MVGGIGELRLLVIDDNAQMRTIIGTVLSAVGVRDLHYAGDGRQGLEALAAVQPDVIYVDFEMPGMSGLEFIWTVRSMEGDERFTPIVMLTGHSDAKRLRLARDAGMTEFVAKPVSAKTIVERLNAVIMFPRPFVSTQKFFGPDRRRRQMLDYPGPSRRKSDKEVNSNS